MAFTHAHAVRSSYGRGTLPKTDRKSYGCFALKIKHGKHLVELKRRLNKIVGYKGVELITISRPTAYGEYAPYQFIDTEQEFEQLERGSFLCGNI